MSHILELTFSILTLKMVLGDNFVVLTIVMDSTQLYMNRAEVSNHWWGDGRGAVLNMAALVLSDHAILPVTVMVVR